MPGLVGYYAAAATTQRSKPAEAGPLDSVLSIAGYGGRQHYLRFQVPDTWRHWEEVGLAYDSTTGYADHEGFRCGTCHPFRPSEIERDRETDVGERPLIAMDTSLRAYSEMSPSKATESILQHAWACKRVSGEFVLLWHNSSLSGEWEPSAGMYRRLVAALTAGKLARALVECMDLHGSAVARQ